MRQTSLNAAYLDQLLQSVTKMRVLQKQYFKTRDKEVLRASIAEEKIVDDMLNQIFKGDLS